MIFHIVFLIFAMAAIVVLLAHEIRKHECRKAADPYLRMTQSELEGIISERVSEYALLHYDCDYANRLNKVNDAVIVMGMKMDILKSALEQAPEQLVSYDTYFDWLTEVCYVALDRVKEMDNG